MVVPKVKTAHLRFLALTDFASQHSGERCGSGKTYEITKEEMREEATPGRAFFHRLRPPDELHRNRMISGAQIRSGETRQDLKIPTVSDGSLPRALSCSHPEVYPLQTAVRWRFLIPSHATGGLVGGSLQAWTICTTPPFSPTTAPVQVNVLLIPTLTDTKNRHWR